MTEWQLDPLQVRGTAVSRADVPETSVISVLNHMPDVDVISQGGPGGQNDLSIRGSAFSGAGLSVQGLALPVAQTEHFNAELPLPSSLFQAPSVRSGFDQALNTEGHLIGTVDFRLRRMEPAEELTAGLAERSGWWTRARATVVEQLDVSSRAGLSAFGGYEEFNGVDEAGNDNHAQAAGSSAQWESNIGRMDFAGGYQHRVFGARGYYGVNPDWPAREETRDYLALASYRKEDDDHELQAALAWRTLEDDYQLFMPASIYRNTHKTRTVTGQTGGRVPLRKKAGLVWRASGIHEELTSTSLGDQSRGRAALTLIPELQAASWTFHAGLRQEIFEEDVPATLPQAAIAWQMTPGNRLAASYSATVRQPSYTELNYESPASLGNQGLERQTDDLFDLRWKAACSTAWEWEAALFHSMSRHTVDWVRETEESTRWEARDIGRVETIGAETAGNWMPHDAFWLRTALKVMDKHSDDSPYSSRYALDYTDLSARVFLFWNPCDRLQVNASQGYRHQSENPLRAQANQWPAEVRLSYHPVPSDALSVFCSVDNLWNELFEDYPGQDTATGHRYYCGIKALF